VKRAALLSALALLLVAASPQHGELGQETEHTVKPGETLLGIANRAEVSREAIIAANRLAAPFTVRTGQVLAIPRTQRHRVVAGDTPFNLAWRYAVSWPDVAIANNIKPDAKLRRGQILLIPSVIPARPDEATVSPAAPAAHFAWPLSGAVRRGFIKSGRTAHPGIDIVASAGAAVRSAAAGKVIFAGDEPQQYGNLVVVDHGDGWHSAYAFLDRATVREGERVRAGERIGLVGHTGRATRDELHFELRRDNRPVDPAPFLPERGGLPERILPPERK
jgi:murein DD-endopeptidase MepM/ murein hydrolase activator NlpD